MSNDVQTANANHLRARFAAEVLRRKPESVLDVGCGRGALLVSCRSAGVAAIGIEADTACRDAVRDAGFALIGDLTECGDASFDWVTMRHVPHHLPDPAATFAQAFRVCRSGVIVAEPWFDRQDPPQAVADDIDNWLKREDRRRGRVHARSLTLDELIDLVPKDERLDTEWEHYVKPTLRPLADVESEAASALSALDPDSEEVVEWHALRARAEREGITCNGSLMVTFARRN